MLKPFFIFICTVLFSTSILAQKFAEVSGVVSGSEPEEWLVFASVVIKDDTSIVEAVITDEKGYFKIEDLKEGEYSIEIQFLGFQPYTAPLLVDGSIKKIDLGILKLASDVTSLNEVVVKGESSQVSLKLGKKVFNVGKDLLSQSGSATDILDNVPSVSVDPSGQVSLRGNSNVLILINGRKSGLTSTQGLGQIPADNIKSVEVITNPSARYDASGSAGIINVIMKKNTKNNLSGSIRLITGIPAEHRAVASLNYKKGKFNFFSNLGIRYSDYEGLYTKKQRTTNNGETIFLNQREDEDRHDDGGLVYAGMDYYINDTNTITTAFYRNETKDTDETVIRYDFAGNTISVDSTLVTNANSEEKRSYNQFEFNYTKTFQKKGREFTVDVQYDFWDSAKDYDIAIQKVFPTTEKEAKLLTNSERKNDDIVVQTDFVNPVGENSKYEIGIKYENRLITTKFRAEELLNENLQPIPEFNNQLDYKEQIIGVYAQYGSKIKKFSYLVGLRNEYTEIEIKDKENNVKGIDSSYARLFPTVSLSYELTDKASMQLSYSKRINRPSLNQLNPFPELLDFNSRFFGNVTLIPSLTDSAELTFLQKSKGFSISPSVYYSYTTDDFQNYTSQNEEGVFETTFINLDNETRYGVEISTQYSPFKWLSLMGEFNFYSFEQKGEINAQNLDFSDETWYATIASQIQLPKGFGFQSEYNYQAEVDYAQVKAKPISYLDVALSKDLLDKKAQFIFVVSNVFNSRKTREKTVSDNFLVDRVNNPNATRWSLSFIYKFNSGKNRRANRSNRD